MPSWAPRRTLANANLTALEAAADIKSTVRSRDGGAFKHLAAVHVLDGYVPPAAQCIFRAGRPHLRRQAVGVGAKERRCWPQRCWRQRVMVMWRQVAASCGRAAQALYALLGAFSRQRFKWTCAQRELCRRLRRKWRMRPARLDGATVGAHVNEENK
jgi:hypothetical protein